MQEKQKEKWSDYLYQRILNKIGGEIIISVLPDHYVKLIYKQYIGYNGVTILDFFTQLQTWYVISNGDKLKMIEYFHAPWTETPDAHASTYAAQINEHQLECVDFDVVISDAAKTIHFVGQMGKSEIFEPKFIDDYDDEVDKSWATTTNRFVKQYDRKTRRVRREADSKDYESMAAVRGLCQRNGKPSTAPAAATATEYIAALEEKAALQDEHIEELLAYSPPALVPTTDVAAAASTITSGSSRHSSARTQQLTELQAYLAAMIKTVATQAAAMTALTKQVANGASTRDDGRRGDGRRTSDRRGNGDKKPPTEKHACPKCKLQVWHKEENCPEYERNSHKRWAGWKSALK